MTDAKPTHGPSTDPAVSAGEPGGSPLAGQGHESGVTEPSTVYESEESRHPVDLLADEFTQRWRDGENPTIAEYINRSPEHRDLIQSLFPAIETIERVNRQQADVAKPPRHSPVNRTQIGDFRLIREIGRGGMGVVYEAIQHSLGRHVPLKVLGSGISNSPHQLQRFRREAEAAARLHHTNIVPVYGIGEEAGIHFYAMQYIDGVPLSDAINAVKQRSSIEGKVDDASFSPHSVDSDVKQSRFINSPTASFVRASDRAPSIDARPNLADEIKRSIDAAINDPTVLMKDAPPTDSTSSIFDSWIHQRHSVDATSNSPRLRGDVESGPPIAAVPESNRDSIDDCFGLFQNNTSTGYFFRIAAIGAQIANALDYAHLHGVLHRDIKPSNLMLDRGGDVWIMDFGLVKMLEKQDLTTAGEIVGTLRYMAPEQLDGRALVATDIYALGLTLYELVTLQPAFDGDQAISVAQRLRATQFPRPSLINPRIPLDLETIILKATANEPKARYATAGLLADDLERFCNDQPILARRTGYLERLWRWSRRNPALAAATLSTIFLLGVVNIVTTASRISIGLEKKNVEAALKLAEGNVKFATDAFDSILDNVTSRGQPRSLDLDQAQAFAAPSPADVKLMGELLEYYRKFTLQNVDNTQLRERTANAHRRAGHILARLGRLTEAEEDYRGAIAQLTRLQKDQPANIEAIVQTASIYNDLGELALRRGQYEEAFLEHLEARALLLNQPEKLTPSVRFELARSTDLFASIDIRSGKDAGPDEPRRPIERRLEPRLQQALPPEFEGTGSLVEKLAAVLNETAKQFRALVKEFPGNSEYQYALAQCLRHQLVHAASSGNHQAASDAYQEAITIFDRLRTDYPNDPKFLYGLGEILTQSSRAESDDQAMLSLVRAIDYANQLTETFPGISEYQLLLGTAQARRAELEATNGNTIDAELGFKDAIKNLQSLAEHFPDQGVIQIPLATTSRQLADLLRYISIESELRETLLERSREVLEQAIERFEAYLTKVHADTRPRFAGRINAETRSSLYLSLAETLSHLQQKEAAEKARAMANPRRLRGSRESAP